MCIHCPTIDITKFILTGKCPAGRGSRETCSKWFQQEFWDLLVGAKTSLGADWLWKLTKLTQKYGTKILLMEEIMHQLRLVVPPTIYKVLYIPGDDRRSSEPSTVSCSIVASGVKHMDDSIRHNPIIPNAKVPSILTWAPWPIPW